MARDLGTLGGGTRGSHHKATAMPRSSGQMGKSGSHLISEMQKDMKSPVLKISDQGKKKGGGDYRKKKNLFIIKTTFCSNFLDSWG